MVCAGMHCQGSFGDANPAKNRNIGQGIRGGAQEDRAARSQVLLLKLVMDDNRAKRVNPLEGLSELLQEELLKASGKELEDIAREWGVDPAASAEAVDAA